MKKTLALAALLFTGTTFAQDFIHYRDNDPFVFCTYGRKEPDKCWWPISPASATYFSDPTCDPPDEYGRPWTEADYQSLDEYINICPKALGQGTWKGSGTGENVPNAH